MSGILNNGVKPSTRGGKREGSGRKKGSTDALREKFKRECQAIASSHKFFAWAKIVVETGFDGGEKVDADTRSKIWDKICDRGFGRPEQALHFDPESNRIIVEFKKD